MTINKFSRLSASVLAMALSFGVAAHGPSGGATAQINGGVSNSVNTNSFASGIGSTTAVAGSTGSTSGVISVGGSSIPGTGGVYEIRTNASAAVDTKTTGYIGLEGQGQATGLANMKGWADGGGTVSNQGNLGSNLSFNGTGSVDAGRPTNVMHGPDVALSTTQFGTGVSAVGVAGGTTSVGAVGTIVDNGGTRTVSLTDTKDVSTYAATNYGTMTLNNVVLDLNPSTIVQLNAGAEATANVQGQYNISNQVNVNPGHNVSYRR